MHLIQSSFLHGETGNSIEGKPRESPGGGRDRYVGKPFDFIQFQRIYMQNESGKFHGEI